MKISGVTTILLVGSIFSAIGANAANRVCGKVNFTNSKGFVSQQWQDAGDGDSCFGEGMVDVIIPANVKFKLYQHLGGKCSANQNDSTIRVSYSLDVDSSENCQLFMIKEDGTKATISFLAPIGS